MIKAIFGICLSLFLFNAKAEVIQHQISDDGYVRVPLQFPFPLYGQVFTESFMFSNGVIGFLNPQTGFCCHGEDLRYTTGSPFNYAIMPLWTDLLNYGNGRFLTEGTPQFQRYYWENISEYGRPNNLNTFGVTIRPSGSIDMEYSSVKIDSHNVTIGVTGNLAQGQYQQFYTGWQINQSNFAYNIAGTIDLCVSNPLSSPSCAGYQEAYRTQQCAINPLYDATCPHYAEAYHDYQCTINPLYATDCDGYAQAYHDQQCSINPLYDRTCQGYSEAYALANLVPATNTQTVAVSVPQVTVSTTGTVEVETPIVSNPIVNETITKKVDIVKASAPVVETPKQEEKKQTITEAPKKSAPVRSEMAKSSPEIKDAIVIRQVEVPQIIDVAYQKLLSKNITIKDNARVNRLMNYKQDLLHKEIVDEQWRR